MIVSLAQILFNKNSMGDHLGDTPAGHTIHPGSGPFERQRVPLHPPADGGDGCRILRREREVGQHAPGLVQKQPGGVIGFESHCGCAVTCERRAGKPLQGKAVGLAQARRLPGGDQHFDLRRGLEHIQQCPTPAFLCIHTGVFLIDGRRGQQTLEAVQEQEHFAVAQVMQNRRQWIVAGIKGKGVSQGVGQSLFRR